MTAPDTHCPTEQPDDFALAAGYWLPSLGRGVVWADVVAEIAADTAADAAVRP